MELPKNKKYTLPLTIIWVYPIQKRVEFGRSILYHGWRRCEKMLQPFICWGTYLIFGLNTRLCPKGFVRVLGKLPSFLTRVFPLPFLQAITTCG